MNKNPQSQLIFIRVKRQKSIYFFECGSHDNIDTIKRRILPFYKNIDMADIRLYLGTRLLDDKSNIHDQDIRNDSLVHFKLKKATGGEWEEIAELGV